MTKKRVVVFGFYGHGNSGDEAFKPAFQHLWGDKVDFFFKDQIPADLSPYDAMMIGGGSFLDQQMPLEAAPNPSVPEDFPIAFVGVGHCFPAHPSWGGLLRRAKIVVYRDGPPMMAPDLVFARKIEPTSEPREKHLVVLGNDFLVPKRDSPRWKVDAWNWFEGEFAKTLDRYIAENWSVRFIPMAGFVSSDYLDTHDDRVFAIRIASQMKDRWKVSLAGVSDEPALIREISAASLVFTMRFHGCVFSTMLGRPFVAISHHDKIKSFMNESGFFHRVDFYGLTADRLYEMSHSVLKDKGLITDYKEIREDGYAAWQNMSGIVAEALSL